MDRKTPQSVGDVLRDLLEETDLQGRMEELKARDLWSKVVGREIAHKCGSPFVDRGIMTVSVPDAPLRHELFMNRSMIRSLINEPFGKEIIKELRFKG